MILNVLLSLLVIFVTQKYFLNKNLTEKIEKRSSHSVIATASGGTSIFICLFIYTSYYYFNSNQIFDFSVLLPLAILYTVGLYDDIYKIDFKLKFIFQVIVAKIFVDLGFYIDSLNGFLNIYEIPYIIGQVLTIILFLLIVNAVNFTDGIDGLAISEVIKSLLIILFIVQTDLTLGFSNLFFISVLIIVPLYLFNLKKNNKVFLGDSGSLLLGGIVFMAIVYGNNHGHESISIDTFLLLVVSLTYPILDLSYVVLKRISRGKSPFLPDRGHLHHFLLKKGFSHSKTLIIISVSSGIAQLISVLYLTN